MAEIDYVAAVTEMQKEFLPGHMGLTWSEARPGFIAGRFEVEKRHLAPNGFLHAAAIIALADSAFVFSAERDGSAPWLPNRVTKQFIRHLRRSGVGRFRLHDLRHFMATQMLGHGVAVVTVAQRLGHARASTTLNVYGHCIPGADLDAARFISALITAP